MKNIKNRRRLIHEGFEIGIVLKGINGLLEMVGGMVLLFVSTETVRQIIKALTYHELSEDPHDIIARYLLQVSRHLSISSQMFGAVYLLSHGIIKIFLIVALWKRKLWAYPAAMVVFGLFMVYQIYRYLIDPSLGLILLTVLDAVIIVLTWFEFQQVKHSG